MLKINGGQAEFSVLPCNQIWASGTVSGFHVDGHQAVIFLSLDESRVKQKRDESYQRQALQKRPIMI